MFKQDGSLSLYGSVRDGTESSVDWVHTVLPAQALSDPPDSDLHGIKDLYPTVNSGGSQSIELPLLAPLGDSPVLVALSKPQQIAPLLHAMISCFTRKDYMSQCVQKISSSSNNTRLQMFLHARLEQTSHSFSNGRDQKRPGFVIVVVV